VEITFQRKGRHSGHFESYSFKTKNLGNASAHLGCPLKISVKY
jgi:hypothetical protein